MILTTKGKYAVLAMIDMCINHEQKPVSLASIAKRNNLSISYLEQIFFLLKKNNIVRSIKGPGGGYVFAKNIEEIKISEIIKATGEQIKITNCQGKKNCAKDNHQCRAHHLWSGLESKIYQYLNSINLSQL